MALEMNLLWCFLKQNIIGFQPKYYWVEIKYLGAIQSRPRHLFCRRDNAFFQYTSAAMAAWGRELERLLTETSVAFNISVSHVNTILPIRRFLHEQFLIYKYSSILNALLHSQSHVLGFYV